MNNVASCYYCKKKFPLSQLTKYKLKIKTGEVGKSAAIYQNQSTKQKTVKIESGKNIYSFKDILHCKKCKPWGLSELMYFVYFISFGWVVKLGLLIFKYVWLPVLKLPITLIKKLKKSKK